MGVRHFQKVVQRIISFFNQLLQYTLLVRLLLNLPFVGLQQTFVSSFQIIIFRIFHILGVKPLKYKPVSIVLVPILVLQVIRRKPLLSQLQLVFEIAVIPGFERIDEFFLFLLAHVLFG